MTILYSLIASIWLISSAFASDNLTGAAGAVKNSSDLCWRNNYWTPATAEKGCDGALVQKSDKPLVAKKVTLAAGTLFGFDKSSLTAEGKSQLDAVVAQIGRVSVEVIIVTGHTDSVGTDAYNQKLGQLRADAVKVYLVSKGIPPGKVYAESRGEKQPAVSNATKEGRAKNRRVDVEVIGLTK